MFGAVLQRIPRDEKPDTEQREKRKDNQDEALNKRKQVGR
jgi:hypothetical protein